ncbi:MAG: Diacylglycerol O-acyltransferase [Marmoricola sp.]|nr:Diacylglycerol O-acyltransferase [Marmoricola sp.]
MRKDSAAPTAINRMSGFDAGFFYAETPTVHQHVLLTVILEQNELVTFENVVAGVLDRLDLLPPLRRRTVHVPFALHHPVWVTVPSVDVDHHFRRSSIGGTGARRDLDALTARLASTPLEGRHPLWELHFCEGASDGRVAIILKMHHSLGDGAVVNALLDSVVDVPSSGDRPAPQEHVTTLHLPSRLSLVRSALRDVVVQLPLVPALLLRSIRGMLAAARYQRRHRAKVPTPILSSPKVSFNGSLTSQRSLATVDLPMDRIKAIRAQYDGITVNDLLLACVSGALRRWLAAHDEHPSRSLTVGIPVCIDEPGAPRRLAGNNLSTIFGTLATDIDDPALRLRTIATTMRHAKELDRLRGPGMLRDWFQVVPGGPISLAIRAQARLRMPDLLPSPFNLQVSNTPGPREPQTIGPIRISELRSTGPLLQGNALGVVTWSYLERMNVTLMACPDLLADVEVLASYLPDALEEYDRLAP